VGFFICRKDNIMRFENVKIGQIFKLNTGYISFLIIDGKMGEYIDTTYIAIKNTDMFVTIAEGVMYNEEDWRNEVISNKPSFIDDEHGQEIILKLFSREIDWA